MSATIVRAWTRAGAGLAVTFILTACGGGGGGVSAGLSNTGGGTTTTTMAVMTLDPVGVTQPNAPLLASGSASFQALPVGTVFPLTEAVVTVNGHYGSQDFNATAGQATLTFLGVNTPNGLAATGSGTGVYQLRVPGVHALGEDAKLPRDGTLVTLAGSGYSAGLAAGIMTYTMLGEWVMDVPNTLLSDIGVFATGFQTPSSGVPSGSATYSGGGGAVGLAIIPDGNGSLSSAVLSKGTANIVINFSTGLVTGTVTGLVATDSVTAAVTPWNDVRLAANMSGATMAGGTSTPGAPAGGGNFALSGTATGTFKGALYGPNGQELGAVWTLSELNPSNGKQAMGFVGATKR